MPVRFLVVLIAASVALAACSDGAETIIEPATIRSALSECMTEHVTEGLARLDSLHALSPGQADVLATRGLCRAIRFAADSVQADARAGYSDLSAAIDLIMAQPDAFETPIGRLYNQRAFVVRAMRPDDWPASIADLSRAVDVEPENAVFVLDRGVARALSGDTAAARADLRTFERLAPDDSIQALSLRDLLVPDTTRAGTGE